MQGASVQSGGVSFPQHVPVWSRKTAEAALNIVIVDDQTSARTMLRHVIEDIAPELSVHDFGDPLTALAWCESHPVDLLLLDYRMPEMDGLEFARRFRRLPKHRDIPVILITVVGDEPIRQAALEAGVIDFLVKPIRPRELRARCYNLLQLRQQSENVKQRALSLEQRLLASMHEVEERERETLSRLARAIEFRDAGTSAYLERMAHVAGLIAEQLGLPEEECKLIEMAAPLHDMGKIAIPDAVLLKQGKLNEEELAIMRRHPRIGYELLSGSQNRFIQVGALIALRHHERYDGSGYPDGPDRRCDPAGSADRGGGGCVRRADLAPPVQGSVDDGSHHGLPVRAAWPPVRPALRGRADEGPRAAGRDLRPALDRLDPPGNVRCSPCTRG